MIVSKQLASKPLACMGAVMEVSKLPITMYNNGTHPLTFLLS